ELEPALTRCPGARHLRPADGPVGPRRWAVVALVTVATEETLEPHHEALVRPDLEHPDVALIVIPDVVRVHAGVLLRCRQVVGLPASPPDSPPSAPPQPVTMDRSTPPRHSLRMFAS